MVPASNDFGARLRWWRHRRGLSQLELGFAAGTSQRHLSFLESGRTAPSREMVLRLAGALDLPLGQQNALLQAAGFAPAWHARDLAAPDMAIVNRALDHMLAQQEPFPAVVVDRCWNLKRANQGAGRLTRFLAGATPPDAAPPSAANADAAPAGEVNLAEWLLSPAGLRPVLANWHDVALHFLRGVHADAMADGTAETASLLQRLLSIPGVPGLAEIPSLDEAAPPVLVMDFRRDGTSLRLFTTIATLGTPQDVTLQNMRVECFFPADDASAGLLRGWATGS